MTTLPLVSSRRRFLAQSAASALSLTFLPRAFAVQDDHEGPECVLRVCVTSDVHFTGSPDASVVRRFRDATRFVYDYSARQKYNRFDALMVVGDMSNNGVDEQLSLFKQTMDEEIKGDTQTLLCMGNHEFYGGNQQVWREKFGVDPNARYEVGGFQFIAVSPEKGTMKDGDYLYALGWLEEQLEAATSVDPGKPVFVFQHYPVSPTVYGSRGTDDWGADDFFDLLQQYPQVVNFSGHTHYPLADPRVVWQGNFTAFGTSTMSHMCHGAEGGRFEIYTPDNALYSEMYIMEVREDNSVLLLPYDVANARFHKFVHLVYPGKPETYRYTDKRYYSSERPEWSDSAVAKVLETTEFDATVEVPQARCRDVVHSYRFEPERAQSDGSWLPETPQYFWSRYYDSVMPETIVANLDGLEPNSKYRAKIVAINPYRRESSKPLVVEFATRPDPDDAIDHDAAEPLPNLFGLRVVDGKLVSAPVNAASAPKTIQLVGAPSIVHDPELGHDVVGFNNDGSWVKIPCDPVDFRRLRRVTFGVRFKAQSGRTSGFGSVLSCTELRGISLSVNYAEKRLEFWASVGDAPYSIVSAPIEFDRWYVGFGVFDGRVQRLFLDGVEVAAAELVGALSYPSDRVVQTFGYGGDVAPGGKGTAFFSGRLERAGVWTWPLTAEQVASVSKSRD